MITLKKVLALRRADQVLSFVIRLIDVRLKVIHYKGTVHVNEKLLLQFLRIFQDWFLQYSWLHLLWFITVFSFAS
jgi:hypothetical protein